MLRTSHGFQGLSIRKNETEEEAIADLSVVTKGEFKMVYNMKLKNYVGYPIKGYNYNTSSSCNSYVSLEIDVT